MIHDAKPPKRSLVFSFCFSILLALLLFVGPAAALSYFMPIEVLSFKRIEQSTAELRIEKRFWGVLTLAQELVPVVSEIRMKSELIEPTQPRAGRKSSRQGYLEFYHHAELVKKNLISVHGQERTYNKIKAFLSEEDRSQLTVWLAPSWIFHVLAPGILLLIGLIIIAVTLYDLLIHMVAKVSGVRQNG